MQTYRKEIFYAKPIYVGTAILDLSKVCMMDFHYNIISNNFGVAITSYIQIRIVWFTK